MLKCLLSPNFKGEKMIDLHIHSNFSDGTASIGEILETLKNKNIKYFSITDHDTIMGNRELLKNHIEKLREYKLFFLPGIEFSTKLKNKSVHILAYGFSLENPTIQRLIEIAQEKRKIRTLKRIDLLKSEFNIAFPENEKQKIMEMDNPGRVHVAKILIKMGYETEIVECIRKYLFHTIEIASISAKYLVTELSKSGIFSFIAHPLSSRKNSKPTMLTPNEFQENVNLLTPCGLKGLECFYSEYGKHERDLIISTANENKLLLSAGSDYHGLNKTVELGELGTDITKIDLKEITFLNYIKQNQNEFVTFS